MKTRTLNEGIEIEGYLISQNLVSRQVKEAAELRNIKIMGGGSDVVLHTCNF